MRLCVHERGASWRRMRFFDRNLPASQTAKGVNMAKVQSAGDLLKSLFSVRRGERLIVTLLFLWFALFISSYYIMRGVRRGLVIENLGADSLPVIYMGAPAVLAFV